ncbi:unnamed protein product [Linum tenue]|uniref:Uncharacterized protein n=1 Tax=Linum tenue TaxID=586396 RepID=A0AAV0NJN4_9ROSI|nr:unnamed protein product [Linum tenue]
MATGLRNIVLSIVTLLAALFIQYSSGFQSTHPSRTSPDRILMMHGYLPRRSNSRPGRHG